MKALIEERLANIAQEYTHYFPAWTVGFESAAPFKLGPVSFLTRLEWINSVDFSQRAKDCYQRQIIVGKILSKKLCNIQEMMPH